MSDNIDINHEEQDLNEILKVRRMKLTELQENNKDPFKEVKYDVTHSTIQLLDNFEQFEGTSSLLQDA